jgi:hypothetical protein
MKSKTPPPPEDFEPRFKIEPTRDNADLLDNYTVRQDSYLWTKGKWKQIGQRYSTMSTHKISEEALKALEDGSLDKQAIAAMKDKNKKELKK